MVKKHLEILTEEPSAEAALKLLLPKIIGTDATYKIIAHQGKYDLLKQLPNRLKAYKKNLGAHERIIVLVDRDKDDCGKLKVQMEKIAEDSGLISKTKATGSGFHLINRIAIEEMEAWFLGDVQALRTSYPNFRELPGRFQSKPPDNIANSWEVLEKLLKQAGYHSIGGKITVAKKIAKNMTPDTNRSKSFRVFIDGIKSCL